MIVGHFWLKHYSLLCSPGAGSSTSPVYSTTVLYYNKHYNNTVVYKESMPCFITTGTAVEPLNVDTLKSGHLSILDTSVWSQSSINMYYFTPEIGTPL